VTIEKRRIPLAYKTAIFITLIIFFALYGVVRAKNFIKGPEISISYPNNGEEVLSPEIEIKGKAKNISNISLNGRQIFTNDKGEFKEHLLLPPGYTIIEVKATDRFGREIGLRRGVIFKQ